MIDTTTVKQNIDLRNLAGQHTTLHREAGQEMSGPCPKCGGTDRFHVTPEQFFCRNSACWPGGAERWGDAIAYVEWLQGVDFKTACAMLAGGTVPTITNPVQRSQPKVKEPQSAAWQDEAQKIVRNAAALLASKAGETGRAYLTGRGLQPSTCEAFGLGYLPAVSLPGTWNKETETFSHPKQPAIVIPWYTDDQLIAIRYRFLCEDKHTIATKSGETQTKKGHKYTDANGNARVEKQKSLYGSDFSGILYGDHANDAGATTLVLCEGELNALSIWQVTRGQGIDVLSIGSQDAKLTQETIENISSKYSHVLAWLDERERAKSIMAVLPGAHGMQSPRGKDANDWLQAGILEGLIFGMLRKTGWTPSAPVAPEGWATMSWAEKLILCSDRLGFTWRWLEDGRLWTSRDVMDKGFVKDALVLFRQIDRELN